MTEFRPQRQPLVPPGGAEHHVRDMTVTVAADMTLRDLQARLAEHGQWLPIDGNPEWTVGRLVETNSTGPLRSGYGAWRDLLLGCQFHNGRGELITAGGRTVKNVAGYDLTKFMIGQRGVFGRLVTLTARTYRRPPRAVVARCEPDQDPLPQLLPTNARPQWAILNGRGLHLGYLGDEAAVAYYRSAAERHAPAEVLSLPIEQEMEHRQGLWRGSEPASFRVSVAPARLREFLDAVDVRAWSADPVFGVIVGAIGSAPERERIRAAADAARGTVVFADEDDPAAWEVSVNPDEQRILQRLKLAFDPDGTLAPLPY